MLSTLFLLADAAADLPADDGFDPGLFFGALIFFGICLVLLGIGLAFGATLAASAAVLVAIGVISSSALVGFWVRRWSTGFRMLNYQLCSLAALPGGILLLWLASRLFHLYWSHQTILWLGMAAGAVGGLLVAGALDLIVQMAGQRWDGWYSALQRQL